MNKHELVRTIASKSELTMKDSEIALQAIIDSITETLASGDSVKLVGFGNFEVKERAARKGRNPQTREEIDIPASKIPNFKVAKNWKKSLNV